ncbi:MAG: DUF1549 and DUF1553 domain-containing protein [Verrucomicrobiota bacterium]
MRVSVLAAGLACFATQAQAETHWAYLPPVDAKISEAEAVHPLDALLAAAWKEAGLKPAKLAQPRQWITRAAFTLTGLPPTDAQIRRIETQPDEATWKSLIDELLASPAYGERWARHWMDVARYADTRGYNFDQDNRYPYAYTYRDWLIRAFNSDMPFERFVKLQIAADCLTEKSDDPDLAALGFLTVGPRGGTLETIDDRVDVVTRGFLSSTVSCARCHDHKFDPISTKDYYSLYSIFENTDEPEQKPIIGQPADAAAHEAFKVAAAKLEQEDLAARQAIVDQVRTPASSAVYLELAWQAHQENQDTAKATGDAFKRGRYRPAAVIRWRDFLQDKAGGDKPVPRLVAWARDMATADTAGKSALCLALANEMLGSPELKELAADSGCPLSYDVDRIREFFDQEDGNQNRKRVGDRTKLENDHPGSPPRAMSLRDREKWSPAQVYLRGNPASRGDEFEREWLSFLGGGKFEAGKSPRLSLAEKITDPANPLTARVMVNRIWGWHFGNFLADPEDFGVQQNDPPLRPVLDWLSIRFRESGGSLKAMHRLILTSAAFRLAAEGPAESESIDQANLLFWKWKRRRADFETARDHLLVSSGALQTEPTGGRSISLDSADADRRRTLYAFVDRYDLAGTFVSFDLPHPDHHAARRAETTVPQQALYFLNSPLVLRQAEKLASNAEFQKLTDDATRLTWIYQRIYQRSPDVEETRAALDWIAQAKPADYQPKLSGNWEIRHAPDSSAPASEGIPFPLFADGTWKTGPDVQVAPIPWLSAGKDGGHVGAGHQLILRWRASGAGQVRMLGELKRTQQGGATLGWNVTSSKSGHFQNHDFAPDGDAKIESEWITVGAGDTVDLVLRAPQGDACGGVAWKLRMMGRESPTAEAEEVGNLRDQFPTTHSPPPAIRAGDPWADLIQMLWASNEFNFID